MAKNDSSALDKVVKLLELASDKGATENEAANALAAARRLMLQHNISEATVGSKKKKTSLGFDDVKTKTLRRSEGSAKFQDWEINLSVIIAEYFGIRATFQTDRTNIAFYGFGEDGRIAEYAFSQVLGKIWDLAAQFQRDEAARLGYVKVVQDKYLKSARSSYIYGIIVVLYNRLQNEKKVDTSEETAIVLSRESIIQDYLETSVKSKPVELEKPITSNIYAFKKGAKDGEKIQIVQGIEESQKEKLNG